ncbi:peptide chain release factor N(5)-glutamine methyltransferase [Ideonella sp. B7]|uniref:peptide chain release factor N(5)-glutamine methyltransferase n=1 Tax=Ideonella benzenivorans TaxID=2831643 RepID=UPI001CED0DC9|nr:peptide chain release factor N(5)-glutamine methyltransferase [Ideonella benzenivorans]MCA6218852.1 peptide chain release factor N(5)-glutamine methyltransferase [Ideonella benzenivorans]
MSADLTIAQALRQALQAGLDRVDAHLLLGHVLQRDRSWLIAHDNETLSPADQTRFVGLVHRRLTGEPVAYLLGEREFHGLTLQVSPAVLVPRPDTETLVEWALECLGACPAPQPRVIDLGTGSGAIALALRHRWPTAKVTALDASPPALAVAAANAQRLGLPLRLLHSDWWQAVAGETFDLAVSNPPYIAGDDPHLPTLRHEPRQALTPEGDGLDAIRAVVSAAPAHLAPGAWLLVEHGWDQAQAVQALLRQAGFQSVQTRQDLAGRDRCTGGQCAPQIARQP